MKVELFYRASKHSIDVLGDLLRRHLSPDVSLTAFNLDETDDLAKVATEYVKLIHAALPPSVVLGVRQFEGFGRRVYFQVYYSLFTYPVSQDFHDFDQFVPAVAIRRKMALVPMGLSQALSRLDATYDRSISDVLMMNRLIGEVLTGSFGSEGLIEVDFGAGDRLAESVRQLNARLRRDLVDELRNYAVHHPEELDLEKAASDLDVDAGFMARIRSELVHEDFYGRLGCELRPQEVALAQWTRMSLSIRNQSDQHADVEVVLTGPIEILPKRLRLRVAGNSTGVVEFALKATEKGEFPLEVVLALADNKQIAQWLPVFYIWIRCA
jgi:hypothetical protein